MKILCGVPELECTGGKTQTSASMGGARKMHGSRQDAFNCRVRQLLNAGYIRRGSREFKNPDGGYILVLTKKSRFGEMLRKGKAGGETGGSRYMPRKRTGGVVISK